jgi:hypothetical protein
LPDEALLAPGIKLKQSSPKGEGERLPNPTLAITDGTVTIKVSSLFHSRHCRQRTRLAGQCSEQARAACGLALASSRARRQPKFKPDKAPIAEIQTGA